MFVHRRIRNIEVERRARVCSPYAESAHPLPGIDSAGPSTVQMEANIFARISPLALLGPDVSNLGLHFDFDRFASVRMLFIRPGKLP